MSMGCGVDDWIPDKYTNDKVNHIMEGHYYGSPNPVRGIKTNSPRECVWHDPDLGSTPDFTAPIVQVPSSTNGIIEWTSDHFDGQLRGNLIASKYQGVLYRVILKPDGQSVIPQSDPPIPLTGGMGMDVTQAPDGTLIECRLSSNNLAYHQPIEPATSAMQVKSVFPTRGPLQGGNILDIYGVNFAASGSTVQVGGVPCSTVVTISTTKLECILPAGTTAGMNDVVVTSGGSTYTFKTGYRYITGEPVA